MPEKADVSRLKKMEADGIEPEMPPIRTPHLVEYLWEVGPTLSGGMSGSPLTQEELRAWQDNIGFELQPWEIRLLVRLSKDYLGESHKATKPDCPSPWASEEMSQHNRDAVARQVRNSMQAYFMAKGKK